MTMSSEQQELIDLLRNELAEIIGYDTTALVSPNASERLQLLEDFEIHAENIGNAARLVGLVGLARCCECLTDNFIALAASGAGLPRQLAGLINVWPRMLLGYLQYIAQPQQEARAVDDLLNFLADPAWPEPLDADVQQQIKQLFCQSTIEVDDEGQKYPEQVTDEMASLAIADDINPHLLKGLLTELPTQVDAFDRAVEQYLITGEPVQLRIAQRVAHTVKGAANVVGIAGIANLTHYLEDILEIAEKSGRTPAGMGDLLQDAADCLSSMSEFLAGIGPRPTNVKWIIESVLAQLRPVELSESLPARRLPFNAPTQEDVLQHSAANDGLADDVQDLEDRAFAEAIEQHLAQVTDDEGPLADAEAPPISGSERATGDGLADTSSNAERRGDDGPATRSEGDDAIPLLHDVYHPPTGAPRDESVVSVQHAAQDPVALLPAPGGEPTSTLPHLSAPAAGGQAVLQEADDEERAPLNISEAQAQELLRLSGESQIGNTQILNRLDTVASGIKSATAYQLQLHQLAQELEHVVELQTSLASARSAQHISDIDPLELERLNELNSFASQLREVTTDAYEAVADLDDELKFLKSLVQNQRQLGFESQELLLNVRMLPVAVFTSRFNRCVRQVSRLTGKPARLIIKGEDVLVDSRVLTALLDPIMHLLRNAVDHGLENSAAERSQLGKSPDGVITLSFRRVADSVSIECTDDGRGLDYDAIAARAADKGLAPADASLSTADLNRVILSSGFSTRDEVTQTSGRGVGLDVVSEQIKALKGTLVIDSQPGEGSRFTLTAPMTILSAHTLLVTQGQFSVSIVSRALEQIAYVQKDQLDISGPQWYFTLATEEHPIPVFALERLVLLDPHHEEQDYKALIVTRNQEGERCGVLVESIVASEEQIIKPLNRFAMKIEGVIGATILGDGRVSPVIDLYELPGLTTADVESESWRQRFEQRLAHLQQHQPKARPVALIVDDSLSARRSLAQFVGDMGMDVCTARDGFEAIEVIEQRMPHIILVDLEMPRMNGLELTHHLRANQQTKDIPIIMITSRATEKHKSLASRAGVTSYLNKPWTDEELLLSINTQMTG